NFKKKQHGTTSKVANAEKKEQMDNKCICRKEGHFQKDCPKRKAWLEKKGIHYVSASIIGYGILIDNLYKLKLNVFSESLFTVEHNIRMNRSMGKQTKHSKKGATRSNDLLEIIHTDICGPFDTPSFTEEKYVITFIDDFSRYGYVYLLYEKSQSINALEVFVNEVERQLDRKVKMKDRIEVNDSRLEGLIKCFDLDLIMLIKNDSRLEGLIKCFDLKKSNSLEKSGSLEKNTRLKNNLPTPATASPELIATTIYKSRPPPQPSTTSSQTP
nr:retrovirus-related Pol polyprotein from transposon TNT 1-94 [Tanacetum cinerariifolium]